jgi:DUF4097 and DUF4098 domain-containing protein YvlB
MKFNIKKFVIVLASIVVGSFIVAGLIFYFTGGINAFSVSASDINTSKTFEEEYVETIVINTVDTDINLIPAVIGRVDIDFYGNVRTNLSGGIPKLKTDIDNGVLNIEITYPRTINIGLINLSQLNLDIYIPSDYSGDLIVNTISGNMYIKKSNPSFIDFQSTSGALFVESVDAEQFKIKTTSGKIDMYDASGIIDVDTISGDVEASLNNLAGDLKAKTISGEVMIGLPEKSQFIFDLQSISGDITNEFRAEVSFADSGNIEGSVGSGVFKIEISTTSGNINIMKGEK